MATMHRTLDHPVLPVLQASNGPVYVHPDDRKYGALLVGGQGSGKTSAELRMYLNDIKDPNASVIVMDPKSELAKLCLSATPPDCGKNVWYLNLGRPEFGMSPLKMHGHTDFATEATQIAENIVAALLDINEGQLFQSSKRYLYHAVIGELAYAAVSGRRPQFENVYGLLMPKREDLRNAVARACGSFYDLDQTSAFFQKELPDDLQMAGSSVAQRLDAPRNKVSQIVGIPALRRFFNHPTDVRLSQIIQKRDILIVDANMAALGEDNAQACIHFIFRQLHSYMQRAVQQPEHERARVALICDEGHYLVSRNVIRQIATHRAAGLDVTIGLQFFAQLGAGAENASSTEEIRKGVLNLLQSRFMFRLGEPEDAETATRIAMAVYQTMIRSDPQSRAELRVTPEQVMNLPVHYCIASWIANGTRAGSFVGQTFKFPELNGEWADIHMERLRARGGQFPKEMGSTLNQPMPTENELTALITAYHARRDRDDGPSFATPTEPADRNGTAPRPSAPVPGDGAPARKRARSEEDEDALEAAFAAAGDDEDEIPVTPVTPVRPVASPPVQDQREEGEDEMDPPADAEEIMDAIVVDDSGTPEADERLAPRPASPGPRYSEDDPDFTPDGEIKVDIAAPAQRPDLDTSAVRRVVGNPPSDHDRRAGRWTDDTPEPGPEHDAWQIKELALIDRVNHVGELTSADTPVVPRGLKPEDYGALAILDRAGLVARDTLGRLAYGNVAVRTIQHRLGILHKAGYIAHADIDMANRTGRLPRVYAITEAGMKAAQTADTPAIHPDRTFRQTESKSLRLSHDHHALHWLLGLQELLGPDVITDHWRTPRYPTGHVRVPQVGTGRTRHPAGFTDLPIPAGQMIDGLEVFRTNDPFNEIAPDISIEVNIRSARRGDDGGKRGLTFDLLLELDRADRSSYNKQKFIDYDALLTAWWTLHPRYEKLGARPVVVFVCTSWEKARQYASVADEVVTGRVGYQGTSPKDWYFPGREHIFFTAEEDLYNGSLRARALPKLPPAVRSALGEGDHEQSRVVSLLPPSMIGAHKRKQAGEE